ncbi:hypothetical protein FF80_01871 [Devosia sp. LC5]|uniref:hypothetical protein n=1 Tax=Devosia sp. LC5 TaxID=1502724 RepID=UPI0004E39FAD|nr:hypothetical protein [Devosia sp. LC5]KFC68431.1 hypothetical protein FF80_01871 [Devosia sp. LC5]
MAFLKKTKSEPYVAQSLADSNAEYGVRAGRLAELRVALNGLRSEAVALERELGRTPAPVMRPSVAALLGDEVVDERTGKATRMAELRRLIADHEAAVELQTARVNESKGAANIAACDAAKPEYGRRVAALAAALETVAAARADYQELVNAFDAEEISWTRLGVFVPNFLGPQGDGHIERFVREAKEYGYVS